MRTLIVSETIEQTAYWRKLFTLVMPEAEIVCAEFPEVEKEVKDYDLIFLFASTENGGFYRWLEKLSLTELPTICSVENLSDEVVLALKKYDIKGYLNVHCSLDELSDAIRIVLENKGTYLNFVK